MKRMGIDEILASKRDEIIRIAAKHGVSGIRVFGSVAHGEAGPDSEVDFLIELAGRRRRGSPAA
jgi:predicted nucleotidyltransferase